MTTGCASLRLAVVLVEKIRPPSSGNAVLCGL